METLLHNIDRHRYEIHQDGVLAGFAEYTLQEGVVVFHHTEVLPAFEGKGLAARLTRHALDDVRAQGLWAIPVCDYVVGYIRKHPEYGNLVHPQARRDSSV